MAGDGLTDEEAVEFWKTAKLNCGTRFPQIVKETCEIALLGGGLLVAYKFSASWIILALYWILLGSFALRIAAHIAFPKDYYSPLTPLLIGIAITFLLTYAENLAINSAANAALIQLQAGKAEQLLAAQQRKAATARSLAAEWAEAGCADTERLRSKRLDVERCVKLSVEMSLNDHSTDPYYKP